MRLSTRLWLWGAAVPAVGLVAATLVAGQLLRRSLEESLDRALLTQAAVESVSLFDGPDGLPHLHMSESPLERQVHPFAPSGALFGPDGALVVRYPQVRDAPAETVAGPPPEDNTPRLVTRTTGGHRQRELTLGVRPKDGSLYTLRLTASLGQLDASVETFHRVGVLVTLALAVLLVLLQLRQARRLARRLGVLHAHVGALREGRLEAKLPEDDGGDEIAELREVLAAATARLREANASQDRLVADAAHELRTPLGLMRTSIDLALRRERSPQELRQVLCDARTEVDRLAALATRLLDLAAVGHGGWVRAAGDLRALVEVAVEAARAQGEHRRVRLVVEGPSTAAASFDAAALRQALDNLLSNALRFSPEGGTVRLTLAAREGCWAMEVADEGPGIPAAEREAVFAPFHRLDRGGAGAGLGLAIVREVAGLHGGRAYVADSPGPGARVALEIAR